LELANRVSSQDRNNLLQKPNQNWSAVGIAD
jgi:hypothetical protein